MRPLLWCLEDQWSPTMDHPAVQIPLSQECVEAVVEGSRRTGGCSVSLS